MVRKHKISVRTTRGETSGVSEEIVKMKDGLKKGAGVSRKKKSRQPVSPVTSDSDDYSERSTDERPRKSVFDYMFGGGGESRDDYTSTGSDSSGGEESLTTLETDEEESFFARRAALSSSFRAESEDTEEDPELIAFDRSLRDKHSAACKYLRNGKFTKALKKFEQILSDLLERYGETHHRVGAALHNVGIANLRAGRLDDAMDAIEEAIRIRKLTLGKEHPKVADSLVELGIILLSLKEYSDSMEIFEEALELREMEAEDLMEADEMAESNLKIAKLLNNIGCVNFERGKYPEAKEAFEDAINLQKEALGDLDLSKAPLSSEPSAKPGFLTMASTMCNKGYIELEQKIYFRAIETFKESLSVQKVLLSADNKLILSTLDNLGYAQTMNGDYDKALETYNRVRETQENCYKENNKDFVLALRKIVYIHCVRDDYETALSVLGELEDVQLALYEPESKQVRETRELMGAVNYELLKYPSAMCFMFNSDEDGPDLTNWKPKLPTNGSKMSGHRVTYA